MKRFATRIGQEYGDDVVFKGGVVLELRLAEARATRDLDLHLSLPDPPANWADAYTRIASRDHLPWVDIDAVMDAAQALTRWAIWRRSS